jgi:MoaA/NifB/PqqE/SkfB family radical SAM enzyme
MTADDWERVIDDAHALSVNAVQFIGGEPTFHPELPRLVRYALGKGLNADVYTNLVQGSHARTRANIVEALRRGIPIRAGIVEVVDGQDTATARDELLALGVADIHIDRARGVGRAARGTPDISELCGQCGRSRAAITLHGDLSPCVIGRFLVAGNVKDKSVSDILGGARWHEIVSSIPAQTVCAPGACTPNNSNDCDPSRKASGLDAAR